METDVTYGIMADRMEPFDNAVKKVLWAVRPLRDNVQRVLALKAALERLSKP